MAGQFADRVAGVALDRIDDFALLILCDRRFGELPLVLGIGPVLAAQCRRDFRIGLARAGGEFGIVRRVGQQRVALAIPEIADDRIDRVIGEQLAHQPALEILLRRQSADLRNRRHEGLFVRRHFPHVLRLERQRVLGFEFRSGLDRGKAVSPGSAVQSESQARAELDPASRVGCGFGTDYAEAPTAKGRAGHSQVRVIERVEEVAAKLQAEPFGDVKIAQQ